jgi:hypothetical protein
MTEARSNIEAFFGELDAEGEQEAKAGEHEDSFFKQAPDAETFRERLREYDDIEKHLVRREHWLKTARQIHKEKGDGLRLLTLPGRYRFEVELYHKHNLLETRINAQGEQVLGVVGFESSPDVFGLLDGMNPKFSALFHGDILAALIDEKSAAGKVIRRQCPYDIVNLDMTVNLATRAEGPYSPFLRALRECFQIQGSQTHRWALMVTFRAGLTDTDPQTIETLSKCFQDNVDRHAKVREACLEKYKTKQVQKLMQDRPEEGIGQLAAKWIIDTAHQSEWQTEVVSHMCYERTPAAGRYSIRKLVFEFVRKRLPSHEIPLTRVPDMSWHIEDVVKLFRPGIPEDITAKVQALRTKRPDYLQTIESEILELQRLSAPDDYAR